MVTRLSAYITDNVDPYKNLAIEEFLTFHVEPSECILFLWQNKNTVVIGKNQNAWKECNVHKLEEDGGHLVRRLSGGGAVFHDLGNLNFTFCVREEDYDIERQMDVILQAVRNLGINAIKTGRNDITADGRKFSGNAFYKSRGYCYHHGTLLVDVDQEQMQKYLNVSVAKLRSKGVDSVRSRTVNLKELNPDLTIPMLKESLLKAFADVYSSVVASNAIFDSEAKTTRDVRPVSDERLDWKEIRKNEKKFVSKEWNYGRKIPFEHSMAHRFTWGEIEIKLHVTGGIVKDVIVFSDAMEQDISQQIRDSWIGCPYDLSELSTRLDAIQMDSEYEQTIKQDIGTLLKNQLSA